MVFGGYVCECEKCFVKQSFRREKGAVIYVRDVENNARGRRQPKVNLLCTLQQNKTSVCLNGLPLSFRSSDSNSFRVGTSSWTIIEKISGSVLLNF